MIRFDTFCYLQNHKTGCTFVEAFLRRFSREPVRGYRKHAALAHREPQKFCFVNVRAPLDVYLSLYSFGLDGHGEVRQRLHGAGRGALYAQGIDGFERWLAFVLDPANGALLSPRYAAPVAAQVGFVSYRFLRLACPGFEQACAAFRGKDDLCRFFERAQAVDRVIRYEALVDELSAVAQGPLQHAMTDVAAATDWIRSTPAINASSRRDRGRPPRLPESTRGALREREWFLYERFYA